MYYNTLVKNIIIHNAEKQLSGDLSEYLLASSVDVNLRIVFPCGLSTAGNSPDGF
jgi:hypothetical protein